MCNNLAAAVQMAGVCEALSLGAAAGLNPATLSGVLNSSSGACWSTREYNPVPVRRQLVVSQSVWPAAGCARVRACVRARAVARGSALTALLRSRPATGLQGVMEDVPAARGYAGGFNAALMSKDLRLAQQLAISCHQPFPMGETAARLYQQVCGRMQAAVCCCSRGQRRATNSMPAAAVPLAANAQLQEAAEGQPVDFGALYTFVYNGKPASKPGPGSGGGKGSG